MTFTAEAMPKPNKVVKPKRAEYPFAAMRDNPGTGFVISVDRADLFANCRTMASLFNSKHGTKITCNKQLDGSMRVWNECTQPVADADLTDVLEASVNAVEQKKQNEQAPTKEQFVGYLLNDVTPGMSITLGKEYVHRFLEFTTWIAELDGYSSDIIYNPPSIKITRKAGSND